MADLLYFSISIYVKRKCVIVFIKKKTNNEIINVRVFFIGYIG